jgi:DNA polymerase-3 subunit alpha
MEKIPLKERTPGGPVERPKQPPARCSIACRQYLAPATPDLDQVTPYTHNDLINREKELLGVYLTGSPFDRVSPEDLAIVHKASDIEIGPEGEYLVAAIINRVKLHTDRTGNRMAFLSVLAQDGEVDVTCFASTYATYRRDLVTDKLWIMALNKNSRGVSLTGMAAP